MIAAAGDRGIGQNIGEYADVDAGDAADVAGAGATHRRGRFGMRDEASIDADDAADDAVGSGTLDQSVLRQRVRQCGVLSDHAEQAADDAVVTRGHRTGRGHVVEAAASAV